MKIKLIPFTLVLFALVLSCSQKPESNIVKELYNHLVDQKEYYYEVEYSEGLEKSEPSFHLFGTGKLIRNKNSGISKFYFGLNKERKDNYLQLIQSEGQTIEQLQSLIFAEDAIDVLTDSLHSAILLNPDLILALKEQSSQIHIGTVNNAGLLPVEFIFENEGLKVQLESDLNRHLRKINIYYTYSSGEQYHRSWSFRYLDKSAYLNQIALFQQQFESKPKTFL